MEVKEGDTFFDRNGVKFERDYLSKSTSFPLDKSIEKALNDSNQENHHLNSLKYPKIQSDSLLNSTYSSPLSPIYQKQNDFLTPKHKRHSLTQKSAEKLSPLCLSDFMISTPVLKKKSKKGHSANESVRRITPTCLNKEKGEDFRKTINCFDDFNTMEISVTNFNQSRNFLLEERHTIFSKQQTNDNNISVLSRKFKTMANTRQEIDASRLNVSNENALNNLANIYVAILNNSLVLNITSEIYFLISLLTKKQFCEWDEHHSEDLQNCFHFLNNSNKNDIDLGNHITSCSYYFRSIHNVIYFVVKCLESQIEVLKYFDKTTVMLLADNQRLKAFSKKFSEQLRKISETKSDRVIELLDELKQTNVCFNLDTDNRDNFPSDVTFHSFRKQRDLFYEILRIWEINHLQPGWNFSVGLTGKIKSLLYLVTEPINFVHFCRLFKDQLLSTCGNYHKVSIKNCVNIQCRLNNLLTILVNAVT